MDVIKPTSPTNNSSPMRIVKGEIVMEILLLGHPIFSTDGVAYYLDFESKNLKAFLFHIEKGSIHFTHLKDTDFTIKEILTRTWFALQPFDARKAMRERLNEYVGAHRDGNDWYMIGLTYCASTREAPYVREYEDECPGDSAKKISRETLDKCIPIQWVPYTSI